MRHQRALRKLGRTTAHRMAMLRNLSTSFFDKERITTTLQKAKELRPFAERMITLARRDDLHSRRLAGRNIQNRAVLKKLFGTLGPRFSQRPGGYSRILKLGWRQGDGAEMAILELLGSEPTFDKGPKKGKKGRKAKRQAAARGKTAADSVETAAPEAGEAEAPAEAAPGKKGTARRRSGKKGASSGKGKTKRGQ